MIRLRFLRHGNTFESNQTPYQVGLKTDLILTEKGLNQAKAFAEYSLCMNDVPYEIYCGSLKRQLQTAKLLHQTFPDATIYTHEKAFDEIDYGPWEGLTTDQIKKQWPKEYADWEQGIWPSTIFEQHYHERMDLLRYWLESIRLTAPNDALIVAVTSQGIMRLLLQLVTAETKMKGLKVGTGHFCDLIFTPPTLSLSAWDQAPVSSPA